ncbi:hypothetical protein [Pseudarthrobacter sulfonivorans]|uniref:hypothetical protein n=1 Tax=Pseudarthrobacter sulfonivorans TaxID=121292 RepID=UPI0021041F77|nr:hypothetical protein [Pseudarthrobacter sulfonivorans]
MYQQDEKTRAQAPAPAEAPVAAPVEALPGQEFYFPYGSGVDPDLFMPEDRVQPAGRISLWIQALPVFSRSRR